MCFPLGVERVRRGCAAHQMATRQSNRQPASEPVKAARQTMAHVRGEENKRLPAFRPLGGRALAQTLCARRGPLPELLPQPESVNMILLLSRAETLLTLGRESLVLVGTVANSGDPSHQTADSQTADSRQHRGERSAGMLEMSRRVGGAESRRQAQSVGHAHGWAGWMGAPSVLLFLLKRTEEAHF